MVWPTATAWRALQQRLVVLLTNTKPRNVGGVRSFGLVLCGNSHDGSRVELLDPPTSAVVGERIAFPPLMPLPASSSPLPPLVATKAKPEVLEAVMAALRIDDKGVAVFSGGAASTAAPMTTSAGPVTVHSLKEGSIK